MAETKIAARQMRASAGSKSSDQSVSSASTGTTLVDCTGIRFWCNANEKRGWRFDFRAEAGTSGGLKWVFTLPSGASGLATGSGINNLTTNFDSVDMTVGKGATTSLTSTTTILALWGTVTNGSTAGWVQFQFAQNASNATNTTIRANSIINSWITD